MAADRHGVSFHRKEKTCDAISLDFRQFEMARDRLISLKLIAFKAYTVLSPNGYYQVLPVEERAPSFGKEILRIAAQTLGDKGNSLVQHDSSGYQQRTSP